MWFVCVPKCHYLINTRVFSFFIGKSHTMSVNNEVENYFNLVWEGRMFETILYT